MLISFKTHLTLTRNNKTRNMLKQLFFILISHGLDRSNSKPGDKNDVLSFQILTDIYKYGYETLLPIECFRQALLEVEPFSQAIPNIMKDLNTDKETDELNSDFNQLDPSTWYLNLNIDVPYADGPLINLGIHHFDNSDVPYDIEWHKSIKDLKKLDVPDGDLTLCFDIGTGLSLLNAYYDVTDNSMCIKIPVLDAYNQTKGKKTNYQISRDIFLYLYSAKVLHTIKHEFRHACDLKMADMRNQLQKDEQVTYKLKFHEWVSSFKDKIESHLNKTKNKKQYLGFMDDFRDKPLDRMLFNLDWFEQQITKLNNEEKLKKVQSKYFMSYLSAYGKNSIPAKKREQLFGTLTKDVITRAKDIIRSVIHEYYLEEQKTMPLHHVINDMFIRHMNSLNIKSQSYSKNKNTLIHEYNVESLARTLIFACFILDKKCNNALYLDKNDIESWIVPSVPKVVIFKDNELEEHKQEFYDKIVGFLENSSMLGNSEIVFVEPKHAIFNDPSHIVHQASIWIAYDDNIYMLVEAPIGVITLNLNEYDSKSKQYELNNSMMQALGMLSNIYSNSSAKVEYETFQTLETVTYRIVQNEYNVLLNLVDSGLDKMASISQLSTKLLYPESIGAIESKYDEGLGVSYKLSRILYPLYNYAICQVKKRLVVEKFITEDNLPDFGMDRSEIFFCWEMLCIMAYDISLKNPVSLAFEQLAQTNRQRLIHDCLVKGTMFESNKACFDYTSTLCKETPNKIKGIANIDSTLIYQLGFNLLEESKFVKMVPSILSMKSLRKLIGDETIVKLKSPGVLNTLKQNYQTMGNWFEEYFRVLECIIGLLNKKNKDFKYSNELDPKYVSKLLFVLGDQIKNDKNKSVEHLSNMITKSSFGALLELNISKLHNILTSHFVQKNTRNKKVNSVPEATELYVGFKPDEINAGLNDLTQSVIRTMAKIYDYKNNELDSVVDASFIYDSDYYRIEDAIVGIISKTVSWFAVGYMETDINRDIYMQTIINVLYLTMKGLTLGC